MADFAEMAEFETLEVTINSSEYARPRTATPSWLGLHVQISSMSLSFILIYCSKL